MWSAPVVILLAFFERFANVARCVKERFIQTFVPQLTVKALDKAVLLGFSRCDLIPIDAGFLHPLEYRHASEFSVVVRYDCLRHAPFSNYSIQLTRDPLARQLRVGQMLLQCRDNVYALTTFL